MKSTPGSLSRRRFLSRSLTLAASGLPLFAATAFPGSVLAEGSQAAGVRLQADPERQEFRVRLEMDVKGNVNVPDNPLISRKRRAELPITSRAVFDYEERFRFPEGVSGGGIVTAAERYYHEATSDSRLNRNDQTFSLRDSVRQTVVRRELLPETIYAVDDYFDHQELELLQVPASSMAVDELLPTTTVMVGSKYTIDREAARSLLNLSSVETSSVEGELVELTEADAKIRLSGSVTGSVDGVPTNIRVVGKLTFDRQLGFCSWLAMALHETREIGKAEPGFDVAASIKMLRKPLSSQNLLSTPPLPLEITEPVPADRTLVALRSEELGYSVLMDRRWRMMRDAPGSAMMRMIERDRSVAQCDVRSLAVLPEGRQWTLEAFQREVHRTLGDRMTQVLGAEEGLTDLGLRGLQITANGQVQGVPIRWVVIHVEDDQGRRLLATFTMDAAVLDTFAGSDVQFANSLQFTASSPLSRPESSPGSTEKGAPERSASNENAGEQVQSSSDLR